MQFDVVALGELLIDFIGGMSSPQNNPIYEANPGGAPCNVLAMLTKLGATTSFIGKVGNDIFGHSLKQTLNETGIDSYNLIFDDKVNTTLAFVKHDSQGDRSFSFFRNPGADTQLNQDEIDYSVIENCKIFHFGSLSLTHTPSRLATIKAVKTAKTFDKLISFDPNLRPLLWTSLDLAREQINWGISKCDILKISDEELTFLTELEAVDYSAEILLEKNPNIKILFVTTGKKGAEVFHHNIKVKKPTFTALKTIDTTGAGDTFCGACLAHILEKGSIDFNQKELESMITFANAAASLVTTKKGALRVMPSKDDITHLINFG